MILAWSHWQAIEVSAVVTSSAAAGFPGLIGASLELILVSNETKADEPRLDICSFDRLYIVIR